MAISYQRKLGDGTIVIDSGTSNVGIGTNSPGVRLQLGDTTDTSNYLRVRTATADVYVGSNPSSTHIGVTNGGKILQTLSYPLVVGTTQNQELYLGANDAIIATLVDGKMGIGTTNPPRKLSVETNDTATYSASVNASEISIARKNSSNTAGQVAAISLNATGWSGQTTGVVVLNAIARQGNFSNADFAIQNRVGGNFVETFRITTYGDVGIGTDSPSTKLHIADDAAEHLVLKLEQDNADHQVWFEANSEDGGFARFGIGDNDNDFAFWNTDQAAYHWYMGSLKMILTSGGNLGIGTTNPLTKLHVEGGITINTGNGSSTFNDLNIGGINGWSNSEAHRINFVYGNGTSDIFQTIESYYGGANEGKMRFRNFYTNSAQTGILMTIHSNGNVGIGTDSPQQHLDISAASPTILLKATGQTLGAGDVQGSLLFYNNESSTAGGARVTGSIKQVAEDAFGRMSLVFGTSTTDSKAAFGDPGTYTDSTVERLRIKFNGNVGIGTDSPGSKLHISDATNISAANSGVGQLSVEGLGYTLGIALDSTKAHIYHNSALRNLSFGTNESVDMTIEGSTGNVGIGTTGPEGKLDVVGSGIGGTAQSDWVNDGISYNDYGDLTITRRHGATKDSDWGFTGPLMDFRAANAGAEWSVAQIMGTIDSFGGTNHQGGLMFLTSEGGTTNPTGRRTAGAAPQVRMGIGPDGTIYMQGNVGIGTTNPGYKLDVGGDLSVSTSATIGNTSTASSTTNYESILRVKGKNNYSDGTTWYGDYGQIILHSTTNMTDSARRFMITNALDNNKFAIVRSVDSNTDPSVNATNTGVNSGTADFVINNAGNVGIGTTSPGVKLDIDGAVRATAGGAYGLRVHSNSGITASNNYMNFFTSQYNGWSFNSNGTGVDSDQVVRIKIDGKVGIGTTDPSAKLHVVGNGEFYSTIGAADNVRTGIAHYDTTAQAAGVGGQLVLGYKYHDNGAYTEGAIIKMYKLNSTSGDYSSGLKFQVRESGANLSSKMVLDPSGNVGIGTSSPKAALDVNNRFVVDSKTMTMTDSFSDALTVIMSDHTGCYVKITAFGDWGSHSSISYLGEFFLNNGANAYNEPGMIIRQVDGTDTDAIQAQIVDPGSASGNREFIIQLKATATASFTAYLTYTIQGMFVSAS